jgi:ABC-type dipeptide/oligopeptide/nickel transport system permease subunit
VAISVSIGTLLGLLSGYVRGIVDTLVMRVMDVMLAFPGLIFALVLSAILGPGLISVMIAVGLAGVPTFARVTRGAVMTIAQDDYVSAARVVGSSTSRVMFRHILPNIGGSVLILGTLWLGFAVLAAASLSFLGVGVRPPTPEWGAMVNDGRNVVRVAWWVSVGPGTMIMLFVLAVNLVGDVLRDRLDPTLRSGSRVA